MKLNSVQEPDGVSLRVVATIAASPVTPCLVFQESVCLLVGQFHLWLLEVAAGFGKTVDLPARCQLVSTPPTFGPFCESGSYMEVGRSLIFKRPVITVSVISGQKTQFI